MFKKTIYSLALSLLLFMSHANAAAERDDHDGMPSLGAPSLVGKASGSLDDDGQERKDQAGDDASQAAALGGAIEPLERKLDILHRSLEEGPLALPVSPADMLHVNQLLYAKYGSWVDERFRTDKSTDLQLLTFLNAYKDVLKYFADPETMSVCLSLLQPFNERFQIAHPGGYPWMQPMGENFRIFMIRMAGLKRGQIFLDVERDIANLREAEAAGARMMIHGAYGMPAPQAAQQVQTLLEAVRAQLRRAVTVNGNELYDVERDNKALSEHVAAWFNISRRLYASEVELWKDKGPQ